MLKFVAAILDGDHIFQKFLKDAISSLDNEEQGKIREFDQTVLTFFWFSCYNTCKTWPPSWKSYFSKTWKVVIHSLNYVK